jgi:catalase-peroxidase
VKIPFAPGRTDASEKQTDAASFAVLEPKGDGFRNYVRKGLENCAAELLLDKAQLLTLTAPEMTVLIGGLRVLGANFGQSQLGVFTKRPGTLTNDFFVNLLDMNTKWQKSATSEVWKAYWKGAIAKPASSNGPERSSISSSVPTPSSALSPKSMRAAMPGSRLLSDFVAAWTKVMNLDRFDLA